METKTKSFDCVEMMHQGAEAIRKETEGMSRAQQIEYWRNKDEKLKQSIAEARARSES